MARQNKFHHKVPNTYLTAFSDEEGKIWYSDTDYKIHHGLPSNVLREKDYYTIRFKDGGGTLAVETKVLGGIETNYSQIYQSKIAKNKPLTSEERAQMAIFVASMMERVENRREAMRKFFSDLENMSDQMRKAYQQNPEPFKRIGTMHSREEGVPVDEMLEIGRDIGSLHSSVISDMITALAPIIYSMKWTFMVTNNKEGFITSDDPCVIVNPVLEKKFPVGSFGSQPGLVQSDIELTLPLSPEVCLFTSWQTEHDNLYLPVANHSVREVVKRTYRHARTIVANNERQINKEILTANNRKSLDD